MVKRTFSAQRPENNQKIPALPSKSIRSWKVLVTMKAAVQFIKTQIALANPRTCTGKISDITSHGVGPQPKAKPAMKRPMLARAIHASSCWSCSSRSWAKTRNFGSEELLGIGLVSLK
uniref:Uncharacterized protein n=1 Tax=Anguilla anguilla TaxID=7936 RepID=A0A0E9WYX7_ANGAN